ncbi:cation:proton antiporter [Cytophaga hutchinsonii]|uniref:Transporter, CPA2 family n=1 Tax=Cytophaga hutchinsonii (strain ATCC 33406 / DSM 1761 / CIP 103989 / NBRC 15051 / NCIMB 9469 / D465) TaxID=269798 RepID=A0A6N4SVW8_CYTH3|nr:cation:proton antiporter [Cytophaga hutchinsonii]ABG60753.1 transporter, CPA2 family [Cytophaga hutchinsonii ATCC 33406]SFX71181.1 transporter, CPA2 family [Cytophaga hutchinsonii ATCC 33406]
MKKFKNGFFYIGIISVFSVLMYWIVLTGASLEKGRNIVIPQSGKSQWQEFLVAMQHNLQHPLAIMLAQIVTIIIIARLLGWVCKKIGQPSVVGEIIAGIILGPSLIGMYFPEFSAALFPVKSLGNLQFLSQIGLILFMFIVGMELDLKVLRNKAHEAVVISHASIIIPFALGMGLAFFIYQSFAPEGVQFLSFALFLGIAMSITAFPVLARIVQERGIHKTKLGTVVITCAAADDITAWCILAAVIAIVKAGSFISAFYIMGLALGYVVIMIYVIKPFLKRVGELHATRENLSKPIVAIFLLILLISSYATEVIGIHALFGAFMAGAIMPENIRFRNIFIEKVEDVALVLLLPLFFVFTGLRTQIGLLNDPYLWKITGLIILVAVAGKFIGSALAAKFVGQNWKNSLTIGALMNTRGLMELVVLNIGYDLGVLTPEIFTMMVIMALLTTVMTGPALDAINFLFRSKVQIVPQEIKDISKYKILVSFSNPESGKTLLKLANGLTKKLNSNASLTALHLSPTNELHHYNIEEYEKEIFDPIIEESQQLNQKVTTIFKASNDINYEVADTANKGDYDLLLVGLSESIFQGSLLGKVLGFTTRIINPEKLLNTVTGKEKLFDNSPFDESTKLILSRTHVPVGILIDKNLTKVDRIFIPIFDVKDAYLVNYAQKLIHNSGAQVVVLDAAGEIKNNSETKEKIRAIEQNAPNHITLQNQRIIEKTFLQQQDMMIISLASWKKLVETKSVWLSDIPSTLIISEKQLHGNRS